MKNKPNRTAVFAYLPGLGGPMTTRRVPLNRKARRQAAAELQKAITADRIRQRRYNDRRLQQGRR